MHLWKIVFCSLFFSVYVSAQILAPTAVEVDYSYEAYVEVPYDDTFVDAAEAARFQAQHMFGVFSSPTTVITMGVNPELSGGIGAPKGYMQIEVLDEELYTKSQQEMIRIYYRNSGQIILHKTAAEKIINAGSFSIPLPTNPFKIYRKKCTDSYYNSFDDFWYFYDPFRSGCEHLSQEPLSQEVVFYVKPTQSRNIQRSAELPLLRGDNGNGDLFSIYIIQGFSEDKKDPNDDGRLNFEKTHTYLLNKGFLYEKLKSNQKYPLYLYSKDVNLSDGRTIHIQVHSLLVETAIESRSKIFAEFFKKAIHDADVVIYEGHSGLGGNLNIPELEAKAGKFIFPNKKQIYFFDSCSSYSYYLDHFNAYKTKTNIDVITNGLSSYFHTSPLVLQEFLNYLVSSDNRNFQWLTILKKMESVLDHQTYLINVGGL